ncbi:MAG: tRNA lysidine(34) synthetase TilS [Malacoplasma sp.]|nr:tRNA lysidine(34) synthetase TilS [Malacoplasma sp.]
MKKYLIAVSGGPDSMALLNKKRRYVKAVCHINYHDREDTDNDELIVTNFCNQFKIPLFVFDTKKDNVDQYLNIKNPQTYYRKIRFDFFIKIAKQLNIKNCLIAHNRDDFIESAYMSLDKNKHHLFLGIRKKSVYQSLILIRPLLHKSKNSLQKYCDKKQIAYAIDYSNFTDIYDRNVTRKIIANWTKKELYFFYFKIKFHNIKNFFLIKKVDNLFAKWKALNFDLHFFNNQRPNLKTNLIYLYLNHIGIKPNQNKIKQSIEFIEKNQTQSNKKYRIKQNYFLIVKNNALSYCYE